MRNSNRFYHPLHPNPFPLPAPEITKKSIQDLSYLELAKKEERYFAFALEHDYWLKAKPKFVEAGHFIGRLLSDLSYDDPEFSDHYFTVGTQIGHMACRASFAAEESSVLASDEVTVSRLDISQERFQSLHELDAVEAEDWLAINQKYHRKETKHLDKFIGRLIAGNSLVNERPYIASGATFAYSAIAFEHLRLAAETDAAYLEKENERNGQGSSLIRDIMLPHKKRISGRFRL